jgi:hypothetical protein
MMSQRLLLEPGLALAVLCLALAMGCAPAPTPTPLPTPSPTVSATPTVTATATPTNTPAPTATPGIAWGQGAHLELTVVQSVTPTITEGREQLLQLSNCDTMDTATFPMAEYVAVTTTVTIEQMATEFNRGFQVPIPESLQLKLTSAVSEAYAPEFGARHAEVAADELVIPGNKVVFFSILWEEHRYAGTVAFAVAGVDYAAAYTYSLSVPTRAGEREETCRG